MRSRKKPGSQSQRAARLALTARRRKARRAAAALREVYGVPERKGRDPLDCLIQTILSQKTTGESCRAAFVRLKRAGRTWAGVLRMGVDEVSSCIRSAGLADQKAVSILGVLDCLRAEGGRPKLDGLSEMTNGQALEYLMRLPGVGPKTAHCVLMFALGRDVLPVDTHVGRLARRLGLVGLEIRDSRIHEALEAVVAPGDRFAFHVNGFAHGRAVCRSRGPRCEACVLAGMCDYARSASTS